MNAPTLTSTISSFPCPEEVVHSISRTHYELVNSICYAKRIQDAILPCREILARMFPESFLVFNAKDTVSGDFYWYTRMGDKFILAVADCTGHGIPGAMVSMLGYTVLDDIVKTNGISDPAHILTRLNHSVRKLFKQGHDDYGINDGMDIAICTVDVHARTVSFAGANRPLVYFSQGKLKVYAASKNGIGGLMNHHSGKFETVTISYTPGDVLYMFTDGYSDQFGGPEDKKLKLKNFISLLESLQTTPMEEQGKELEHCHKYWKGTNEQTDDILVMGLKLTA